MLAIPARKLKDHETAAAAAAKLTCRRTSCATQLRPLSAGQKAKLMSVASTFLSFLLTSPCAKALLRQCWCSDVRTFILGRRLFSGQAALGQV